jgi:DNA polymerase-3 subunit alpha
MSQDFIHLHVHTKYSLLDGAIRFQDLLSKAAECGMPAIAITDHGNMFGAIEFYEMARKHGVKPILGCEVYVAPHSCSHKEGTHAADAPHHLILLAMNIQGYRNLIRLVTLGYLEGFYYKPRVDKDLLKGLNQGLIALSACLHGEIPSSIIHGDIDSAIAAAREYREVFDGRFYLELQSNGLPEQEKVNTGLLEISKALSLPLVATNDCHYLRPEDARAHDVLLCIQTGKSVHDTDRMRFSSDQLYLKSPEEMYASFKHLPEALQNTLRIADACNIELSLGEHHFPKYPIADGENLDRHLENMVLRGLERRISRMKEKNREFSRDDEESYQKRLQTEIDVIKKMGFSSYFLIVSDFIRYAKSKGIPVGPGRGSAAGSLVAYSLGITNIDPIAHGLIFERFLNLERMGLPDIDVDFCMDRRDEIIKYVSKKYGNHKNVAQIITFGKMQARAVIRDVGRAFNMPYGEVDKIAKLVPNIPNITLDEAVAKENRLQELEENDPNIRELLSVARALEGLPRHASIHAAGVVISDRPIVEYVPLYKGQKAEIVTQYDMKSVEKVGLIKFDFLGLKTLTVMDHAVKLINKKDDHSFSLATIDMGDKKTYELLSSGDTAGVFQLESSGMRDLVMRMRPETFSDLIALIALYRPGPLESGMLDDFIKRKHGEIPIHYELPQLEDILKDTYGVIVYQEQVMKIASMLADYTMGEADTLRLCRKRGIAFSWGPRRSAYP